MSGSTTVYDTLYLDPSAWDLVLDASGNIALATAPYSLAQDVATLLRTFEGECYYDTTRGVPYWQQILGEFPPLSQVKAKYLALAQTVPGVESAAVYFSSYSDRALSGQVQVTDSSGTTSATSF